MAEEEVCYGQGWRGGTWGTGGGGITLLNHHTTVLTEIRAEPSLFVLEQVS